MSLSAKIPPPPKRPGRRAWFQSRWFLGLALLSTFGFLGSYSAMVWLASRPAAVVAGSSPALNDHASIEAAVAQRQGAEPEGSRGGDAVAGYGGAGALATGVSPGNDEVLVLDFSAAPASGAQGGASAAMVGQRYAQAVPNGRDAKPSPGAGATQIAPASKPPQPLASGVALKPAQPPASAPLPSSGVAQQAPRPVLTSASGGGSSGAGQKPPALPASAAASAAVVSIDYGLRSPTVIAVNPGGTTAWVRINEKTTLPVTVGSVVPGLGPLKEITGQGARFETQTIPHFK